MYKYIVSKYGFLFEIDHSEQILITFMIIQREVFGTSANLLCLSNDGIKRDYTIPFLDI